MAIREIITANCENGQLSKSKIARQWDDQGTLIQFAGYPEPETDEELTFRLIVWMRASENAEPVELPPIELEADQWLISNYYTQLPQMLRFQLCITNEAGTYEKHSPIFSGIVDKSLSHNGEGAEIDVNPLFDPYKKYVDELILDAGARVVDTELDETSTHLVENKAVAKAVANVNGRLQGLGYGKPYGLEPFQTSFFKQTENLFADAFCYHITSAYYRRSGATPYVLAITATPNWQGWLIRVKPNTTYAIGPVDYRIDFFDEAYNWDIRIADNLSDTEPNVITTGSKSCWMALTQKSDTDMSDWMMVEGDTYPSEYISGYPQWISAPKDPDGEMVHTTIAFGYAPVMVTYNNRTANITLPSGQRAVLPNGTGPALSSATTLTANSAQFVSYDATADEWFLGAKRSGHETYVIGYVAPSAKFAHFNCAFKEVDEGEGEYTIAFMGDSITAGVAANGHAYHMYLHERYGWTCLNYGFGGAGFYKNSASQNSGRVGQGVPGIAPATTPENFFTPNNVPARLTELDSASIDGIVIFAGTNDWGNNISVADYISGIESAFDYCQTYFPTIPVLVMTPIHRKNDTVPNSAGKTLREYVDILIDECEKYSIPYVDCMTMTGIYPDNDANKAVFFTTDTSGLHPGSEGHKRIANAVGETLKSVLACNDF